MAVHVWSDRYPTIDHEQCRFKSNCAMLNLFWKPTSCDGACLLAPAFGLHHHGADATAWRCAEGEASARQRELGVVKCNGGERRRAASGSGAARTGPLTVVRVAGHAERGLHPGAASTDFATHAP